MHLLLCALSLATPQAEPSTHWTGWMYLDTGDVPVRLVLDRGDDGLIASIDLPVPEQFGVRLGAADETEHGVLLRHPNRDEAAIRIDLRRDDEGVLRGPVEWMDEHGRAVLHPASIAVGNVDEDFIVDGIWGAPGLDAIAIRPRPWGERLVIDLSDGSERTLFEVPDGRRFIGPGMYIATPVARTFELDGDVLVVREEGRADRRLRRRPIERRELEIERGDVTLRGVLTIPEGDLHWCAVIAGGSNWTLGSGLDTWSYALAALGVASITYDKRGHGASTGEREVDFHTTAADLFALARVARHAPGLDDAAVGYLGISRGGWYGALAAASDPNAAFFLDVVGPAVSPIEQETTARLARLAETGVDDLDLARRYLDAQWTFARSSTDGEQYLALRAEVERRGLLDVLHGPADLDPTEWQWLRWNGDFDPREALRTLDCPVLALYGSRDLSVSSEVNEPRMREVLRHPQSLVVTFEGCDHGLRPIPRTRRPDPHEIGGRDPKLWRTIAQWLEEIEP